MYESIKKVLNKEYDHEIPDIPRSKDFARAYKAFVKRMLKPYGLVIEKSWKGSCETGGFITDENGHYVMYMSGDYRYDNVFDRVLYRTARDTQDYTGGANRYCELKDIGKKANEEIQRMKKLEELNGYKVI